MNLGTSNHWQPDPLSRWDWLWAFLLFAGTTVLFLSTMQQGFTRDEGFYFHAASQYIGWFEDLWKHYQAGTLSESFTQANIDRHWRYNPEHPVLMKTAFALSHKLFHEILGWMGPSTALRFPTALTGAGLISVLYLFGRQLFGRTAGFVAAGALLFQPRFFFHAHMACFDVPITFMWVACVYAYWRSYDSRFWALMTGILFGLGLSTKLNAFFLPGVLGLHWLIVHFNQFGFERRAEGLRLKTPPIPKAFVAMATLGPLLFYALWPRHWFDTFSRIKWYMNFHLKHEHYFVDYFGMNLQIPPFPMSYPWVMTLVTVPATIFLGALIGIVFYVRRRKVDEDIKRWFEELKARRLRRTPGFDVRGSGVLIGLNILFPIAVISAPESPIFGGTKHWMPAMPFLALLAGAGVYWSARALMEWLEEQDFKLPPRITAVLVSIVLSLSVLGPAAYATWYDHPIGTGYYNELIGSYRGAADRRMVRKFWGHAGRHALPYVNEHAPENTRIWIHKTLNTAWAMYRTEGIARQDLRASGMEGSDYGLYYQQKAFVFLLLPLWENYGTMAPAHVVSRDGVPYLSVYVRPKKEELKFPDVRH